jgi:TatA/E family protein of Tat protein translocase
MFGTLGGPEILLLLVLALIVFGPRKLPEIGKSMGRMLAEFRRASNDFRRTIEDEVEAEKVRAALSEEPHPAPAPDAPAPAEAPPAVEPAEGAGAAARPDAGEAAPAADEPPELAPPPESIRRE